MELAGHPDMPVVGNKANVTLSCEVHSVGPLDPKMGAVIQLSS